MPTDTRLYWLLGGLVSVAALFVYSRTNSGAANLAAAADTLGNTVGNIARGIRNNNPGNIRKSSEAWQGLAATQTDSAFFQFRSMPYGVRAMVKILRNYSTKYGLNTVQDIINRWAPPVENNTNAYVLSVADDMGVQPTDYLNLDNSDVVFSLVRAIIKHENGYAPALLVTDSAVWQGIQLA